MLTVEPLHGFWIFAVFTVFGLAPGLALTRRARLPACFAPALIFASACLIAYGIFFAHLIHPYAGRQAARICWVVCLGAVIWQCVRAGRDGRRGASSDSALALLRQRDVWLPMLLAALLAGAYVMTLYARTAPIGRRFTWTLPSDNAIPELFALRLTQGIEAADAPVYLTGDWQSSDRPPLQAAVLAAYLPLRVWPDAHVTEIQIVGTFCQIGWVLALWTLARVVRLTRTQTHDVLLVCAGSGFFLINTLYTWPKLLAAWLCLTGVAIVLDACRRGRADSPLLAPLVGGLAALSLLAHGGTFLSVAAMPLLLLPRAHRRVFGLRDAALALLAGALLLGPWMAYQRHVDPPGDRILKHHLAGVESRDARGLGRALQDEYATLAPGEAVSARWANLTMQVRWDPKAPDETLADYLRRQQFFHHSAALDVVCLGLLTLWIVSRGPATRLLRLLLIYVLGSMGLWILMLFTGGTAFVHHGSYAATALLFFCGAAAMAELPSFVRVLGVTIHLSLFAWIWLIARQTSMSVDVLPWQLPNAFAAVGLYGLFGLSLHRWLPADEARETPSAPGRGGDARRRGNDPILLS